MLLLEKSNLWIRVPSQVRTSSFCSIFILGIKGVKNLQQIWNYILLRIFIIQSSIKILIIYQICFICFYGGIGRHATLKMQYFKKCFGSSPIGITKDLIKQFMRIYVSIAQWLVFQYSKLKFNSRYLLFIQEVGAIGQRRKAYTFKVSGSSPLPPTYL